MTEDELVSMVAQAADVLQDEVKVKERNGTQIKANSLWEGSCSPTKERKRVGLFLAKDREDIASEGAIRRLTLQLPFPETVVVLSKPGNADQSATVVGYSDSRAVNRLATAFGVEPVLVPRPSFIGREQPASTLDVELLESNLRETPNVVLQGPPGTGKSSLALELVRLRAATGGMTLDECRFGRMIAEAGGNAGALFADVATCKAPPIVWEFVQFHPAYAYDDLVRRVVPRSRDDGHIQLAVEDGLLIRLCHLAEIRGPDLPVLLVLDEINRGNLAAILGEFVFAIEPGHRGTAVRLQYQGAGLAPAVAVPPNLWIVGTMNTADRSIAMVDYAVRRRFRFLDVPASPDILRRWYGEDHAKAEVALGLFDSCNAGLPPRLQIGHAVFLENSSPPDTWPDRMARRIAYHVLPLLAEYAKEGLRDNSPMTYRDMTLNLDGQNAVARALATLIRNSLAQGH